MEPSINKVANRDAITEEVVAVFAESDFIPERYYRPDDVLAGIVVGPDEDEAYDLPVVDMERLLDPELAEAEIAKLGSACRNWGFFQLVNHGVDEQVVNEMKDSTLRFFSMPLESKKMVEIQDNGFEGYGHHFSRLGKLDWAESLILLTQPNEDRNPDMWPTNPSSFRDALEKFSAEMTNLAMRILSFMATDLGVDQEAFVGAFRDRQQSMAIHRYPPCRHPDKVIGITPHTDGLGLTLLLQLDDTPGLQIRKDGRWFPVQPRPGSFIINVADILQVLTNGTYRSVEHRVLTNAEKGRTTIVTFYSADVDGMVKPIPEVLKLNGVEARYKSIKMLEYIKGNFAALSDGKQFIDSLRITMKPNIS
uniref:Fe2OG dioxygenase domain-containing protein n=1 Tax=Leersia perrieri TaxID=77586 RepID=A0A0D9VVK9_9ORYZ